MFMRPTLFSLLVIVSIGHTYATAEEVRDEVELHPLRGLTPTLVYVTGLEREISLAESIKTKVELSLRRSRLDVTNDRKKAQLFIEVFVHSIASPDRNGKIGGYIYAQSLSAHTRTTIVSTGNPAVARVWASGGIIGTSSPEKFHETLKENIEELSDDFLNEYLKANPL